ncbi:MAG: hypothetical protein MI892_08030 [Desulfobacterales bacterium]|nr:hypothetical protein [Desulfobacterales bacterium]
MEIRPLKKVKTALLTAIVCVLIVSVGILGMVSLAASKRPPVNKPTAPKMLSVSVIPIVETSVRLTATGYGQAEPVNIAEISPQVSGNIIEKHPALDQGGMVEKGDVLIKIDDTDYAIDMIKAQAQVKLSENTIAQYRVSQERDKDRLPAVKQNTMLTKAEYTRLKTLYETDRVGTLADVEDAEQAYNSELDTQKNLIKTIALYPLQIQEAQNDLASNMADLKTAKLNLERCVIRAPFTGRVQSETIEIGTYITAGTSALTLADDSILEIQVPLSDKDAFETLGLKSATGTSSWFSDLDAIGCRLESVTGKSFASMSATVHRAVEYDADSRTLYLAVRVSGLTNQEQKTDQGSVPLLDGMFCKVHFEGREVENVVKAPRTSLNSDNTVFLARDGRLKTLAVETVMSDKESVYITGAFESGDSLVTTALTNPIENTLLSTLTTGSSKQLAMAAGGNNQ